MKSEDAGKLDLSKDVLIHVEAGSDDRQWLLIEVVEKRDTEV